jgi:hypothetical protein
MLEQDPVPTSVGAILQSIFRDIIKRVFRSWAVLDAAYGRGKRAHIKTMTTSAGHLV